MNKELKGYYVGRCEKCYRIIAATCIYDDELEAVAVDVADMVAGGLIVHHLVKDEVVKMEGHRGGCEGR